MAPAGEWVELAELVCPGCHEPMLQEPPTIPVSEPQASGWAHLDGSQLCGQDNAGTPVEPIERWTR